MVKYLGEIDIDVSVYITEEDQEYLPAYLLFYEQERVVVVAF